MRSAYHRLDMQPLQVPDAPVAAYRCCSSFQEHGLPHYTALAHLPTCLVRYPFCLHLKAFYRQLYITYLDCATTVYMSFSNLYRASTIQRYIGYVQFFQAARAEPLIVMRNG